MERKVCAWESDQFEWAFNCAANAGGAILGASILWIQLSHSPSLNAVVFGGV